MIVRTWKAGVSPDREDEYYDKVREIVLPSLRSVPGYRGVHFVRRPFRDIVEILVLTYWDSMASVEVLTKGSPSTAYVPPVMAEILDSFDTEALHYEAKVSDWLSTG